MTVCVDAWLYLSHFFRGGDQALGFDIRTGTVPQLGIRELGGRSLALTVTKFNILHLNRDKLLGEGD